MEKPETLEELYIRKFDWIPENLKNEIGHFNVFPLEPIEEGKVKQLPYKRRDYYKIMLVFGNIDIHYADRIIPIKQPSLVFSNPQIPYKCEHLHKIEGGQYCIFNHNFFAQFGNINQYNVFQPTGNHVSELEASQVEEVNKIYQKMLTELNSDYIHKYDLLRNLVFELIHFASKMQASESLAHHNISASTRISALFLELLERQFPIDENHPTIKLRSASEFADQLNVHVNHLNRSVKEITGKTTTQLLSERLLQESKSMLLRSNWNVSEIAFALGFSEVTHFNNFFKKHSGQSPTKFRKLG